MNEWTDSCSELPLYGWCPSVIPWFSIPNHQNLHHMQRAHKMACDMAMIRRQVIIQNARSLRICSCHHSHNVKWKRGVFFCVKEGNRNRRDRQYKVIRGNREINSIWSSFTDGTTLETRMISCYCCFELDKCPIFRLQQCCPMVVCPNYSRTIIKNKDHQISLFIANWRIVDLGHVIIQ